MESTSTPFGAKFSEDLKPKEPDVSSLVAALKPSFKGLVICLSHSWGGLEQVAAQDAEDLVSLGLKVSVLCLEKSPIYEHIKNRQKAGMAIEVVPLSFRPRDYFDFKLKKIIEKQILDGVNLIHLHQPSLLGSVSPWVRKFPHVALFASRHIMNNHNKKNFFHRFIYSRVDALVAMSHTLRRNIIATHPVHPRQVKVVNLGLDFDRFDPQNVDPTQQRAAWGADANTIVVGLVGRIDPAKGQDTFIKAAAGLMKSKRDGERFKFVIVGEETLGSAANFLEELKKMVAQFGVEEKVVFAGFQEDIPSIMRAFDILVMPSLREAFGLVAVEAMAMECPIIISRGGSSAEIVGEHQEYGLLIRPNDAFDLQRQVRYLIDHPEIRTQMGARARWHVKSNYDHSVRVKRTLVLYEEALRRRSVSL